MKNCENGSFIGLLLVSTVAMSTAQAAPPDAVQCGDVLGPGGTYIMNEDLDCDVSPALTVLDGAHLNLKRHTLTCGPGLYPIGIQLEGQKASVTNGHILECDVGVALGGYGKHSVTKIDYAHSRPGTHVAFDVATDGNRLVRNTATACDGCFEIDGDENRLIHNVAFDAAVGFWIGPAGENNRLLHNVAESQYAAGFLIQGAANMLIKNEAIDTLFENGAGFAVQGETNELRRNMATDNAGEGFSVAAANNRLLGNVAKTTRNRALLFPERIT